ncbi:hypothetical protein ACQKOE_07455 [Novosphingobium sp. NPDC080210]|uniref:hypothetical protein n=1 Tax=Novosphingobium sp. NPDC080210 TaxID=3390596 RepID=UPI003D0660D1
MKVQFGTGTVGGAFIESLDIKGLTYEDGLATITVHGDADERHAAVGEIVAKIRAVLANDDLSFGDGHYQVLEAIAVGVTNAWDKATAVSSEPQTEVVASDEPTDADTGSHSLPTGDESTSNASQASSDEQEEQDENGKQAQRKNRRSRD